MITGFSIALLAIVSCGSDDDGTPTTSTPTPEPTGSELQGQITADQTLTADKIWTLKGRTTVTSGATLTIEPGTIIKAEAGTGANASALLIARGAKIEANGTATAPIIFTSTTDDIAVGQTAGTNLDQNDRGLWGGVIILGNAPASLDGNAEAAQIEGIPASDVNGLYGGTNAVDDSGSFQYVSIRHGGANIGEGNEINGLTLGGVGSGTTINYVEVVANVDDGIEFFGGTVNASNLFVWAQGDDALDIDQAYSGTIDNAVVVLGEASDHALEIDGPEGSATGAFTLQNVTLIGNPDTEKGEIADYRSGATGTTKNVFVTGFKDSSDIELDNNGVAQNYLDGDIVFEAWQVLLPAGVTAAKDIFVEKVGCASNCDDEDEANDVDEDKIILAPSFTDRAADWATAVTTATVGATTSEFSWTYSNTKASLGF